MVADLTGQPLLEQAPQRNFWKLGLSHAHRETCEQISGCTTDVPFRCECGCGCEENDALDVLMNARCSNFVRTCHQMLIGKGSQVHFCAAQ